MNSKHYLYRNLTLNFSTGDFTEVNADGLICPIWSDLAPGPDIPILEITDAYHQELRSRLGYKPRTGETVYIEVPSPRSWNFRSVIFVFNDNKVIPLSKLLHAGLLAASEAQLRSVSMPLLSGSNEDAAIEQTMLAIKRFADETDYTMSVNAMMIESHSLIQK